MGRAERPLQAEFPPFPREPEGLESAHRRSSRPHADRLAPAVQTSA